MYLKPTPVYLALSLCQKSIAAETWKIVKCHSAPWREGYEEWDWLHDCANPCLEEIRPVEVPLPKKWRKKLAFLFPRVGRPGKAFLDHASIWKLYPWAKSAQTEKNWHVRGHHYAIPSRQTSPILPLPSKNLPYLYCPHVQHACCTLYSSDSVGQRALRSTLFLVCRRAPFACTVHLPNSHWALPEHVHFCTTPTYMYMNCSGLHSTVCSACCRAPLECAVSVPVQ